MSLAFCVCGFNPATGRTRQPHAGLFAFLLPSDCVSDVNQLTEGLFQLQMLNSSPLCVVGVPAVAAGKEKGSLGEFRMKLLSFLDISTSYEPARLISDFPFDGENSHLDDSSDSVCLTITNKEILFQKNV